MDPCSIFAELALMILITFNQFVVLIFLNKTVYSIFTITQQSAVVRVVGAVTYQGLKDHLYLKYVTFLKYLF
jgi:hypothetical protein